MKLLSTFLLVVAVFSGSLSFPAAAGELLADEVKNSGANQSEISNRPVNKGLLVQASPSTAQAVDIGGSTAGSNSQQSLPSTPNSGSQAPRDDSQMPPDGPQNPDERGIKIIFGGALCPVCLIAFERRLKSTDGISFAKVEKLPEKANTGHPPKKASAVIFYNPAKISRQSIILLIRQNDFQYLKSIPLLPPLLKTNAISVLGSVLGEGLVKTS